MSELDKLKDAYDASIAASSEAYLVYVRQDAAANKVYMASLDVVDTAYRAYIKAEEERAND